ncbi:hypothetical protein L249_1074 [Ophiocordyceps polyrhachis-furcata BCC 54312]|uniref:Uncharacterized protein n=1 Tax=Ophiocordyceps polyrhachis-furcata BCC 54312 TaxID=1330021 RepID=A0A367LC69_9HYPO|nr:hypothetical protein L249_1074 [Ophiocordyceps polyrhachis-furcata BCC 54312]
MPSIFGGSARHSHTHTQGTRPEGLGGSRDAGPAAAGPRPPYVTAAIRHNNRRRLRLRLRHGYAVQRLRPYGPYGPYEGRNVGIRQARRAFFSNTISLRGSQRPIPRSFFSTFAADTATATATANALVATVPLLLLLSLSNALFYPIFSAAFFVLWFSVLFFPPSSSYGLQRRQEQGQDQDQDQDQERDRQRNTGTSQEQQSQQPSRQPLQQEQQQHTNFLDQFEEQVLDRRVDWLPFFVAPPCLRQIQIRTVGFYEKLRRHEARRPKTKDTIDWLEKHAFLCRKIGSGYGPGPDESTEHSYEVRYIPGAFNILADLLSRLLFKAALEKGNKDLLFLEDADSRKRLCIPENYADELISKHYLRKFYTS